MVRRSAVAAALIVVASVGAVGCGAESKSSGPTSAPTVSLWLSGTAADYRQVAAGAKLALAEAGGRAGPFRVNFAGRQVAAGADATEEAVANARTSLQDTQVSAVLTDVGVEQAKPVITLLNEAGIPVVALGDESLNALACSDESDIYPNGHATAIVVGDRATLPADFRARFSSRLGFAPTASAWRSYQGARSVLASLAAAGVASDDTPPRLDRDALAAELVRSHGDCA